MCLPRGCCATSSAAGRDSQPVDWYTALGCPLPGGHTQVPDLRVAVRLWWQLTASQPHSLFPGCPAQNPSAIRPGQPSCAFTFAHTRLQFRVLIPLGPPYHPKTHTHSTTVDGMHQHTHSANVHFCLQFSRGLQEGPPTDPRC